LKKSTRSINGKDEKMTTSFYGGSAQIIQFPVRVRATVSGHRDDANPAANLTSLRVAYGSNWYHEEAVRESDGVSKQ
jgi:hypothetical protein